MTDHILPLLSWELFNALLKPAGKTIPGDHQTNDIFPQLMICLHFSFLLFVVNLLFLETDCDLAWKYFKSLIMINDEMWQSDIPRSQKMLFGSIWWYALSSDHLTLVPPCCTRRRAQFECCRYPQRSSSSILILSLSSQSAHSHLCLANSNFLIRGLLLPPHTWMVSLLLHHLPVEDLLRKSSFWKLKIEGSFLRSTENDRSSFFWCGTLSHNASCSWSEFLRFQTVSAPIPDSVDAQFLTICGVYFFSGLLGNCGNVSWMQSFSFGCCATSPLFRDCRISIWHWLPHCGKCVRPPLQIFSILAKRVSKFQSKVGEVI